jgi:hypothetical protein
MKINAETSEPTKPGWYVVEYSEFPASPALMYYDERGWQRQPGVESFFGARHGDVWWDSEKAEDYAKFMLRVLV